MLKFLVLSFLGISKIYSQITEEESLRRVHSHFLIEDPRSALKEAEIALKAFPQDKKLKIAYFKALSRSHLEREALQNYLKLIEEYEEEKKNRSLLEELAWSVIEKGAKSNQYGIRLSSLLGAYLTQDVRAVKILLELMRDSNALLRSIAVQLSSSYGDNSIQKEIKRLLEEEKFWIVKIELIKALGKMRMKEKAEVLTRILEYERSTFEEKALAIEALIHIFEDIKPKEIESLAKSQKANLREFACQAVLHLQLEESKDQILPLIKDPRPDVRVAALNTLAFIFRQNMNKEEIKEHLKDVLKDVDPTVSIVASWILLLIDPIEGTPYLSEWLYSENAENRRVAAAALAYSGTSGQDLSKKVLKTSFDPYVKVNIAMGLIGLRQDVSSCCNCLYEFLKSEEKKWMIEKHKNTVFDILIPSKVRYIDQIPNYPEAVDRMSRLNLLSILAIMEDPRAQGAIKEFLQTKQWGITGFAAATLLKEGDHEALDMIRSLLDDENLNIRMQAALVLALFAKDERVSSLLRELYPQMNHDQKLYILEAIAHIGKEDCYPFLVKVLEDPFQVFRVAAASALIKCLNR